MYSLSIIIPVYNVEAYLTKCLDSILVDNMFTGQIICVNDGSKDSSLSILEAYAEKYKNIEIVSQSNSGLSVARNTGLKYATGDYVFFPDSDDWILPGSIDRLMSQINGEEVIYFNSRKFYEKNGTYGIELDIPVIKNITGTAYFEEIYDKPRNMPCVCVCGGIYLRSFLIDNHLYNEPGIYHEDNYFTPQVLLAAKSVSSINEYLYIYRIRKGSITANVTEKHIQDLLFVVRNLHKLYKNNNVSVKVYYNDLFNIYVQIINSAYGSSICLRKFWKISDSNRMLNCSYNYYTKRIAKLTYISLLYSYKYINNQISILLRRMIHCIM